jgi:putative toxin-antitoxin system antitoxin component (TIGR02293 family)
MKTVTWEPNPQKLIARVERGVPFKELEALGEMLRVSLEQLSSLIGISRATLHRRRKEGRLQAAESDRVVRYEQLTAKAAEVFGSPEDAVSWLASPQRGLGGAVPLDYAKTEIGAREVEKLLGRIEYGVYS